MNNIISSLIPSHKGKQVIVKCQYYTVFALLCCYSLFASTLYAQDKERVSVAILSTNDDQMVTYQQLFRQFETATGIRVDLQFYNDFTYKQRFDGWLESGNHDLLYWQAGERLKRLVDNQLVVPIDTLIDKEMLDQQYRQNALDIVTYDERVFALPLGQYIWGFYYNKTIFEKLDLRPPNNWHEFTVLVSALKENGVMPLVQSSYNDWPVLGWLDYFAIDIGGEAYRNELVQGRFGDAKQQRKLIDAFTYLVESELFLAPKHVWRWEETIPTLLHQQVGMTLIAQFVEGGIPSAALNSIGFFPFPYSDENQSDAEVAPMEVMIVPRASNRIENTTKLINFIIHYTAIDSFAPKLGWASVSNLQMENNLVSLRTESATKRLESAKTLLQYFDREASPSLSTLWAKTISESISSRSVKPITELVTGVRKLNKLTDSTETTSEVSIKENKSILNFSTIGSFKGSFMASKILSKVYLNLGYETHINRFPSSESVIKSLSMGADGDLVRVATSAEIEKHSIRVPIPIAETDVVLIGREKESCALKSQTLDSNSKIGISGDALKLQEWSRKLGGQFVAQEGVPLAWRNLADGSIDFLIAFEPEIYFRKKQLIRYCFKKLETIPAFHHLAKKNADLVPKVASELASFKQTSVYKAMLQEFGLGKLDYTHE